MIAYIDHASPLGTLLLAANEHGISGIYFEEHKHFRGKDGWRHDSAHPLLQQAAQQLDEYFAGLRQDFDVPLAATDTASDSAGKAVAGTDFQRAVWRELIKIPYGHTINYAQLAERIGNPGAVRAAGSANGRNPVSIMVPCHRVISSNGDLNGYAGGIERKRYLLALEQAK
jgi:methylated-DNA-[protein]-cysteine S-methyltransferase